jgi:hypothetical protein
LTNQDVEPAEMVDGATHGVGAERVVAGVARREQAAALVPLDASPRLTCVAVLVEVDDRDIGASRANAIATARPMPLSPPVMRPTLPASRPPRRTACSARGRGRMRDSIPGWRDGCWGER